MRRAALRLLSTSSSSVIRARSIATFSSTPLRSSRQTLLPFAQRRWASDDVARRQEDAPISKLQPTPLEEVENAVKEDQDALGNATESIAELATDSADATVTSRGSAAEEATSTTKTSNDTLNPFERQDARFTPKATIYIGNLFFDVTEDDLHREFSTMGPVTRSRIIRDARGLSKGFGYITFETVEDATKAIATMNSQLFEGRRLTVQYASQDSQPSTFKHGGLPRNPPSKTLFIGNMSWEMTDRDLNTLFRGIRNVIDVRVAIDRRTGQPRGFAHADFIDIKSAMEARKVLADKELYGRQLRIDYSFGSNAAPRNQARDEGHSMPPSESQ